MVRIFGRAVKGPSGRSLLALITAVTVLLALAALPVQAVDDLNVFQLDGNGQTSLQSSPPAQEDWDLICKANRVNIGTLATAITTTSQTSLSVTQGAKASVI